MVGQRAEAISPIAKTIQPSSDWPSTHSRPFPIPHAMDGWTAPCPDIRMASVRRSWSVGQRQRRPLRSTAIATAVHFP